MIIKVVVEKTHEGFVFCFVAGLWHEEILPRADTLAFSCVMWRES